MARLLSRLALLLLLFGAAAIALLAALSFWLGALYFALDHTMTAPAAAAVTGACALLLALLALIAGRLVSRLRSIRGRTAHFPPQSMASTVGDQLASEVLALVRTHPRSTVLGSLLIGFAVGASPELRGALANLIRR